MTTDVTIQNKKTRTRLVGAKYGVWYLERKTGLESAFLRYITKRFVLLYNVIERFSRL